MLRIQSVFVIVALACYCACSEALEERNYERSWDLLDSSSEYLVPGTLFNNYGTGYPRAVCKKTESKVEKECDITLVSQKNKDRTCNGVKIFAGKGRQLFLNGFFQVIPYSEERVILAWWDNEIINSTKKQNFKVSILDMVNCKTANLDFAIDKVAYGFFPALVVYSNQIDVVVNSQETCNGAPHCKVSYDLEGKQISGNMPYRPDISGYASPVSPNSQKKGYFMNVQDLQSIRVLLVNQHGEGSQLMDEKFDSKAIKNRIAFSNAHELYGICWTSEMPNKESTTVYCRQFDASGKTKMSSTVQLSKPVSSMSVLNLPDGGLILLVACGKECGNLGIWKIRSDGQLDKSTSVDGPEKTCYNEKSQLEVRVVENKDEYCFEYSCLSSPSYLKFIGKCVPKNKL